MGFNSGFKGLKSTETYKTPHGGHMCPNGWHSIRKTSTETCPANRISSHITHKYSAVSSTHAINGWRVTAANNCRQLPYSGATQVHNTALLAEDHRWASPVFYKHLNNLTNQFLKIKYIHSSNTSTTFTKYPPGYMFRPTWTIIRPHICTGSFDYSTFWDSKLFIKMLLKCCVLLDILKCCVLLDILKCCVLLDILKCCVLLDILKCCVLLDILKLKQMFNIHGSVHRSMI